MELSEAANLLNKFAGPDLTRTLAKIEASLKGQRNIACSNMIVGCGARNDVMAAAALMKQVAGQINVVIHALGILLCLPHILKDDEVVEYVSLGAGNTGRAFDLETNQRVAEFKFIRWQGGPEAIRQNALFKDFYLLAEHSSLKSKYLYILGTEHALKFLNSRRAIESVLSRHVDKEQFRLKFGDQYRTVSDYFRPRKNVVIIEDVSMWLPDLLDPMSRF